MALLRAPSKVLRMVPTIRKQGVVPPTDVIDLLFGCHERIRRLARLAERLPRVRESSVVDVQEAAESLLGYFKRAWPTHVADEDLSIRPRLHEASIPEEVREAMADMTGQHEQIDVLLGLLLPWWELLFADGRLQDAIPGDFASNSAQLREQLETHLALEEETVFPALRHYLSADSESVILREMRDRRVQVGPEDLGT